MSPSLLLQYFGGGNVWDDKVFLMLWTPRLRLYVDSANFLNPLFAPFDLNGLWFEIIAHLKKILNRV